MENPSDNVAQLQREPSIWERLAAPFHPEVVRWRIGPTTQAKDKGMALAYIDARDVMNRLDSILGVTGWASKIHSNGTKTFCELSIKDPETGEWITKTDGAGDTDVEGDKGAISDAFKRAAVCWGVARYLYDLEDCWVKISGSGKSQKIDPNEMNKLKAMLGRAQPSTRPQSNQRGNQSAASGITKTQPTQGVTTPSGSASTTTQTAPLLRHPFEFLGGREGILKLVKKRLEQGNIHEVWKANRQDWMKNAGNDETRAALGDLYAEMSN